MVPPQPLDAIGIDGEPRLTQQDVGEQAAAHADLAVDAPYRKRDAFDLQRLAPRQHVLIDAVNERAVEVEQKRRFGASHLVLRFPNFASYCHTLRSEIRNQRSTRVPCRSRPAWR